MAQAPSYGKAATSTKSRTQKPFPPKKAKAPAQKLPPPPPMQAAPDASGIAQQILGPRVPRSGY